MKRGTGTRREGLCRVCICVPFLLLVLLFALFPSRVLFINFEAEPPPPLHLSSCVTCNGFIINLFLSFFVSFFRQDDAELQAADAREGPIRGPGGERRAEAQGLRKLGLHPDDQEARRVAQGVLP